MNSLLFRLQIYKRNNITKLHLRPPLCPILRQEAFILENTWPPVPVEMEWNLWDYIAQRQQSLSL